MTICGRYRLKQAIKYHEQMRQTIMYARGYPGRAIGWNTFVEEHDELWHRAACEYRCAERLKKILDKK